MDLQLTSKRALVVGGSSGIGLATARCLAAEGARVVIASRRDPRSIAAELCAQTGGVVFGLTVDNRDDASVTRLVSEMTSLLGGVDILVNTAAPPWTAAMNSVASETSDDMMREQFEAKPLAYLRTMRAVTPSMKEARWGRIVNVSGLASRNTGAVAQTVRNVAVTAITKNLADELGPFGINVSVVNPAATRTEALSASLALRATSEGVSVDELERGIARNSLQRLVDANDVASVITFLASPLSVAITGDAIGVGGGVSGPVYY